MDDRWTHANDSIDENDEVYIHSADTDTFQTLHSRIILHNLDLLSGFLRILPRRAAHSPSTSFALFARGGRFQVGARRNCLEGARCRVICRSGGVLEVPFVESANDNEIVSQLVKYFELLSWILVENILEGKWVEAQQLFHMSS